MPVDLTKLYENRLIVLIEDIDNSTFRQVILDTHQFKEISNAISKTTEYDPGLKDGYELVRLVLSEQTWTSDIFEGLSSTENEKGNP